MNYEQFKEIYFQCDSDDDIRDFWLRVRSVKIAKEIPLNLALQQDLIFEIIGRYNDLIQLIDENRLQSKYISNDVMKEIRSLGVVIGKL